MKTPSQLRASMRVPPSWAAVAAALLLYSLALNVARDQVPPGLNNDAAEEALRGVYLLESGRIEAIDLHAVNAAGVPFGVSMETLFLYILGIAARLLGTTELAIHVSTWLFALASIWLMCRLTRKIDPALPSWLPALLAISSIWLFHYARSGLRANTAPAFLLAFTILLDRAEQSPRRVGTGLAAGAALGLSLYGYTACRLLPIAFVIHAVRRLWQQGENRGELLRRYAIVLGGSLFVSIPNIAFLMRQPSEFLFRGAYVVQGDSFAKILNVLWTFLLPVHYPGYQTPLGPAHRFDGVSIGLTAAGFRPVHLIVGIAFLLGLAQAWRRRTDSTVSFLLVVWLTGTLILGISGPSLTRMLLLLPIYLVVAALGLGTFLRFRRGSVAIGMLLLLVTIAQAREYFVILPRNPATRLQYHPPATSIGRRARILAADGTRVLCVVAGNANVVEYLSHDFHQRVRVIEFFDRPVDMETIPLREFQPQAVLLEHDPEFDALRNTLLRVGTIDPRAEFDEFKVDPLWIWRKSGQIGVSFPVDRSRRLATPDATRNGSGPRARRGGVDPSKGDQASAHGPCDRCMTRLVGMEPVGREIGRLRVQWSQHVKKVHDGKVGILSGDAPQSIVYRAVPILREGTIECGDDEDDRPEAVSPLKRAQPVQPARHVSGRCGRRVLTRDRHTRSRVPATERGEAMHEEEKEARARDCHEIFHRGAGPVSIQASNPLFDATVDPSEIVHAEPGDHDVGPQPIEIDT